MNVPTPSLDHRCPAPPAPAPSFARGPWLRVARGLRNLRRRMAASIAVRRQRALDRALLREMSARELHDIGLTRSDVLIETGRPIWRL